MQDSLKNVEDFFKTQVSLFDNATNYVESMHNDLDYIDGDADAKHALNQMRLITTVFDGKTYDYKRLSELKELQNTVEQSHNKMLEKKREALYEVVRSCLEEIHKNANANEQTKAVSEKADSFYTQKKEQIAAEKSLALLDGLSVPMWSYKDQATLSIEAFMKPKGVEPVKPVKGGEGTPPRKEIIKKVARQQMFPARILKTDEEIDIYVESIRKQMKQYLHGSDGIQITN